MANKPNNPALWSRAKSMAKQKFDVYPSAYANGWAAKWYKSKGGTWRKAEYGMEIPMMGEGGIPDNPGFRALPPAVQQKIVDNMAFGGYIPQMGAGGWAQQAAIAIAMKKAGKKPKKQDGGEPDGEMALGQISSSLDKLMKLREFIQPDSDLEPWVSSKLTMMDHYADAVSDYMMFNPEAQEMMMMESGDEMEMMREGGIPQRYRNMGFNKVGQKKKSTRDGKKWMVLAQKGDQYKVVHGGWKGMDDFSQHGSEERKERFWDRMGGRNSAQAKDPFSPLYWHKRFGTWADGGQIPYMKGGGSTWSGNTWYQDGGEPRQEEYPDFGSWKSAHDAWMMAGNSPEAAASTQAPMVAPTAGDVQLNMMPRPQDFPDAESHAAAVDQWIMMNAGMQQPMATSVASQPASAQAASAPAINYSGVSVVDLLSSAGKASDFNSRTKLAEQLGISNYTGTARQNTQMINQIMRNPSVLDSYAGVSGGRSRSKSATQEQEGTDEQTIPGQAQDSTQTAVSKNQPVKSTPKKDSDSNLGLAVGALGLTGALAAAGLTAADIIGTDYEKLASDKAFRGVDKRKLTMARKKLMDEAFKSGAKTVKEAIDLYKKLPARAQRILANLEAMEIPSSLAGTTGVAAQDVAAYNALQEAKAEEAIIAEREAARKAAEMRRFNAQKAAAVRWNKPMPTAPTGPAAPAATRSVGAGRGMLNALKQGYAAARATPLFKLLRREDGGYVPYMQTGGSPDTTFENVMEFFDPTGISSYDDVYRTFQDPNSPWWERSLAVAGALPIVGKFGKAAKAASGLSKLGKAKKVAGKILTPVAQMDNYVNPASRFVAGTTERLLENTPKPVQYLSNFGSLSNQNRRFFTGADLLFGYNEPAKKQAGGPVVGDIMDVTPEELEMLRAQGYDFEMI